MSFKLEVTICDLKICNLKDASCILKHSYLNPTTH